MPYNIINNNLEWFDPTHHHLWHILYTSRLPGESNTVTISTPTLAPTNYLHNDGDIIDMEYEMKVIPNRLHSIIHPPAPWNIQQCYSSAAPTIYNTGELLFDN